MVVNDDKTNHIIASSVNFLGTLGVGMHQMFETVLFWRRSQNNYAWNKGFLLV